MSSVVEIVMISFIVSYIRFVNSVMIKSFMIRSVMLSSVMISCV